MLRGAVAIDRGEGGYDRMVSEFRTSPAILEFVDAADLEELAARGVSTPDLSIRIKTGPMVLPAPDAAISAATAAVIASASPPMPSAIATISTPTRRARPTG